VTSIPVKKSNAALGAGIGSSMRSVPLLAKKRSNLASQSMRSAMDRA
jgi:hypothetical protein